MKKKTNMAFLLAGSDYMRMILKSTLALVLACMLVSCEEKRKSIVILYENDVHCNLDGYARLKGLADHISDTAYVAITSSGDYLHGGKAGAISDGNISLI